MRHTTRRPPPLPAQFKPGPGRGVDAIEDSAYPDEAPTIDRDAEAEASVALGADKIAFLEQRIKLAVNAVIRSEALGHYNSVKNWEVLLHRMRRELDAARDERVRAAEIAGQGVRADPTVLARKVLAGLPALCSVAPKDAEEVLKHLARCLGKEIK